MVSCLPLLCSTLSSITTHHQPTCDRSKQIHLTNSKKETGQKESQEETDCFKDNLRSGNGNDDERNKGPAAKKRQNSFSDPSSAN